MSIHVDRFARWLSKQAGKSRTLMLAIVNVVAWTVAGPHYHYSEGWLLFINTETTIIGFLMFFVITYTQAIDQAAASAKQDEMLRVTKDARNELIGAEEKTTEEIEALRNSACS